MAKKNGSEGIRLWNGISESDFENEENIVDAEIVDYDLEEMILFTQNVNIFRHLMRLSDSLKPVERRILYVMYKQRAIPKTKSQKSSSLCGETMKLHPHGDASIYETLIGMGQYWKTPIPLIEGYGNFGVATAASGHAKMRYTEALLSKYAYECYFEDFDQDCIEDLFNTSIDGMEPLALPAKYPNILINGGFGLSIANQFAIPPFNITDVVNLCKRLMKNPDDKDIYIYPDLPTGCNIVDNGQLRDICDSGSGTLKMEAVIDIEERPHSWVLRIRNIPWMIASYDSIIAKITKLTKEGKLPIKDIQNHSESIVLKNGSVKKIPDFHVIIGKSHDPYVIREKLYANTQLRCSLGVNFKVVLDALNIDLLNIRKLALSWIDSSREYKRRLLNKRIVKYSADKSLYEILIDLTSTDKLDKTIQIIRNNKKSDGISALCKFGNMNSFQATKIFSMPLSAFTQDANETYREALANTEAKLDEYMLKVKSTKSLDEELIQDLDRVLKYATPRKSKIVSEKSTEVRIQDTDHLIAISAQGFAKKLLYDDEVMLKKNTPSMGQFKGNDYPKFAVIANNLNSIMLFDSNGKYSCIPVSSIESTEPSHTGNRIYDFSKLDGQVVSAFEFVSEDTQDFIKKTFGEAYLVTLTKNGYIKKTPLTEFAKRNTRNVRAVRVKDDDELIYADIILKGANLLIYTKKGQYAYIKESDISEQNKDSIGVATINTAVDDECKGICVVGSKDDYLYVLTEKGNVKLCELDYIGEPGKRKVSSYISSLDNNDSIYQIDSVKEDDTITVCTRTSYQKLPVASIPVKARKAKPSKMIPVPQGSNLIFAFTDK